MFYWIKRYLDCFSGDEPRLCAELDYYVDRIESFKRYVPRNR